MIYITVSPHPTGKNKIPFDDLLEYDIIINVSDHLDFELVYWLIIQKIQSCWLPLGEPYGMPLENIYAAMFLLWNAERNKQKVFLHYVAGRNRSRMIADCYKLMKTGRYEEDSSLMLNVKDNQLPGIFRLELFLQKCHEVFENPSIGNGALFDWVKKEAFGF